MRTDDHLPTAARDRWWARRTGGGDVASRLVDAWRRTHGDGARRSGGRIDTWRRTHRLRRRTRAGRTHAGWRAEDHRARRIGWARGRGGARWHGTRGGARAGCRARRRSRRRTRLGALLGGCPVRPVAPPVVVAAVAREPPVGSGGLGTSGGPHTGGLRRCAGDDRAGSRGAFSGAARLTARQRRHRTSGGAAEADDHQ